MLLGKASTDVDVYVRYYLKVLSLFIKISLFLSGLKILRNITITFFI